jgi:hypothetical protein
MNINEGMVEKGIALHHRNRVWSRSNKTGKIQPLNTLLILIYLLTAIGLSPGGSTTVDIYTQTIHRTIQNKQYVEQHNNFGRVRGLINIMSASSNKQDQKIAQQNGTGRCKRAVTAL